ncbi:hypothetical protein AB0J80_19300 [Actinoplanes sp. NPDC049548]|uniref:hypothetical protein n=1 Tax=Actinoplanes sp. NPDC049548 TaxID=3155152 RepID=UPI00342D3A35
MMKIQKPTILALSAAAALAGAVSLSPGAAQAAAPINLVVIHNDSHCDETTGKWAVDWSIENLSAAPATIVQVTSTPQDSPASPLPGTIDGLSTIHATQQVAGATGQIATLAVATTWGDGPSYTASWEFHPPFPCRQARTAA